MDSQPPLVSILMTAYNRENFISEAIESVLASSYPNWELIICDDCSRDGTLQIANNYASNDKRIKVFKNEKNLGDYPNRNRAATYATGEYLMHVDSDDKILTNGIQACVDVMLSYKDCKFGMRLFRDNTETFQTNPENTIRNHFFLYPLLTMGPGGTIIKRSFFKELDGFPEKYGPANDMYFNLKAAARTPVVMIPYEFMFYRRHEGQEINNKFSYLSNNYTYLNDALTDLQLPITDKEIRYLKNKNKRRFLINCSRYLFTTVNINKTFLLLKRTGFGIREAGEAIFHSNSH